VITASVVGFALLLTRAASLFLVAPILSARPVPMRVRAALALAVTLVASMHTRPAVSFEGSQLAVAFFMECVLGLIVGTAARAFMEAALAAGQTLALAAGLGVGAVLDPMSGTPSTAVGEILHVLAVAVAVTLGLHRELFAWFAMSAAAYPPGAIVDVWLFAEASITSSLAAVALAARLAIPVAAATTTAHVVLAVLGRAIPQMSLQNVGFAVPIVVGGFVLFESANDIAALAAHGALLALRTFEP
jgi:flagellar biosynthetic protein FliR